MTATAISGAIKAKRTMQQSEQPFISFGMPMNEYIRKDVFDARMDRMESLLAQTVAEIRLDNVNLRNKLEGEMVALRDELKSDMANLRDKLESEMKDLRGEMAALRVKLESEMNDLRGKMTDMRSEFKDEIRELRSDIRVINARLDTMQTKFGWYMAMFGVVITVTVAAIQILLK